MKSLSHQSPQILKKIDKIIDFEKIYRKRNFDIFAGLEPNPSNVKIGWSGKTVIIIDETLEPDDNRLEFRKSDLEKINEKN